MSVRECCLRGFQWDGVPTGRTDHLAGLDIYVSGTNEHAAILFIADLFGWKFPNIRLLADHYAKEVNATVYVPDFFGGERLPDQIFAEERWTDPALGAFMQRNSREIREPEVLACARELRAKHPKLAAVGYCYGGWAVFRLGAKEHQPPLVDCISTGHPSMLTKADIDQVGVPVQILAPEIDFLFTPELKLHAFQTLHTSSLPFDYQHFPGVEHASLVRGNDAKDGERKAMARAKNAAVAWIRQFLHEE
jgi:dienelactone hydrolase